MKKSIFTTLVAITLFLSHIALFVQSANAADVTVSTYAGQGGAGSADGGPTEAKFNFLRDIKYDDDGFSYAVDRNGIRKISSAGVVTTIYKFPGAPFGTSYCSINIDKKDVIWIVECNGSNVLRISKSGQILNSIAVSSSNGWIGYPHSTGFLPDGRLLVPVWYIGKIFAVSETGAVSVYFKNSIDVQCGGSSASRTSATLCPYSLAVSDAGKVIFASSSFGNVLYQLDSTGNASLLSSNSFANGIRFANGNFYLSSLTGSGDSKRLVVSRLESNLSSTSAVLSVSTPWRWINSGFDIDSAGNIYHAMHWDHTVNVYRSMNQLVLKIGAASLGAGDGSLSQATFFNPTSILEDSNRNLYIKQTGSIRKITSSGQVTTIYKSPLLEDQSGLTLWRDRLYFSESSGYIASIDLQGLNYRTEFIASISPEYIGQGANSFAFDSQGNFFIVILKNSDASIRTIRKISANGTRQDLSGITFNYNTTTSIFVDSQDILWVAHSGTIRTFDSNGNNVANNGPQTYFGSDPVLRQDASQNMYILSTDFRSVILNRNSGTTQNFLITGVAGESNNAAGQSSFSAPKGMTVSRSGDIYIADTDNNVIRKVSIGSSFSSPAKVRTIRGITDVPRPSELQLGVYQTTFNKYFDDDLEIFKGSPNLQNIVETLPIWNDFARNDKSYEWTGYFIPDHTGEWAFRLSSDDSAYLWIGGDAISKFRSSPTNSAVVSTPGIHDVIVSTGSIRLVKDQIYPFRINYGNWQNTGATFKLEFKAPGFTDYETNYRGLLWSSKGSSCSNWGIDYVLVGDLGYEKNSLSASCPKTYKTESANSNTSNSNTNKSKPPKPSFSSVNFVGNTVNVAVNIGSATSSRPDKIYLVAPKLGFSAANPLAGTISGSTARWSIDFDKLLGGTMIPLEIVSERDGVQSDSLTGSYLAPQLTNSNTKVPLAPKKFKQRIVGTSAIITVEATLKAGALATSAFLYSKNLPISKANALAGEVLGSKVVFEIPIKASMAGKKYALRMYFANEVGESKPIDAILTIPAAPKVPSVPNVIPKPTNQSTVICSRASQTRAFSGKKCPPGWEEK